MDNYTIEVKIIWWLWNDIYSSYIVISNQECR